MSAPNTARLGAALVICAPSGTGKTTLVKRLLNEFDRFGYSISYTTRQPREGEVDGRDYCFTTPEEFLRLRDEGFFAEWAQVHDNYYGTPLQGVKDLLAQGKDVVLDIDVQGAAQLRGKLDALFVFILPPSREELEKRLSGRGTDDAAVIATRMANSKKELLAADNFDVWIINDDLEQAYDELRCAFVAATLDPARRPALVKDMLNDWN